MRNIKLYVAAMAVAGLASLPLAAQQPPENPAPAQPQSSSSAQTPPVSGVQAPGSAKQAAPAEPAQSTAASTQGTNLPLRPVQGELEKKLDSKNAKAGDAVVVKTTKKAAIADGVVIPKGSRILGHVVNVLPHSKANENAQVTLEFDQAQLKGGQTLPIRTVLQSVAPAQMNVTPTDTLNAPSAMSTPGPSTGSAPGAAGSAPAGGMRATPAETTPVTTAGSSAPSGSAQTGGAPQAGTVVARQGNVAIKTTAIPGVLIEANVNGLPFSNASGALLGARQNVHLDGGTEVVLAVADAGPKTTSSR